MFAGKILDTPDSGEGLAGSSLLQRAREHVLEERESARRRQRGLVAADLTVALGIIALVIAPLAHGWVKQQRVLRNLYQRSIAMQIVDGEAEIIAAGNWVGIPDGRQPYSITAAAKQNLPPGRFLSTRTKDAIRLEWIPSGRGYGGTIVRTVKLPAVTK